MNCQRPQLERLLKIDREIRSGIFPNCFQMARAMEVSRKTILRDIDYLRDRLGAPLEYDSARKGHFYSERNWFLPALQVSEGEQATLLLGNNALEQYRGAPCAFKTD